MEVWRAELSGFFAGLRIGREHHYTANEEDPVACGCIPCEPTALQSPHRICALPLATDSSKRTPAHVSIESGSQSQQGRVLQCLKALLAATGPSVNDSIKQEWLCSLLRCATQHRAVECVRLLLEYGAGDAPHGDTRRCCLHVAAGNGELGILEALLSAHPKSIESKVCP